jgi:hypothetical protein
MWKSAKISVTELSVIVIIIGLVRQILYYGYFKIPIKDYLTISDLWFVVSDELILTFPGILLIIYSSTKIINTNDKKSVIVSEKMGDKNPNESSLDFSIIKKDKVLRLTSKILVLVIFILLISLLFKSSSPPNLFL